MKKDFSQKTTFYITISLFIGLLFFPLTWSTISSFVGYVDELNLFQKTDVLVKYDWCYPSCDEDVQSSFKFSSDGTFTFSTKTFGGMSRRGTWRDLGNGNIQTNDNQVGTQTVKILSRTRIKVGKTTYNRD